MQTPVVTPTACGRRARCELLLGLHGRPPACRALADAVADAVFPEIVQVLTDGASVGSLLPS